MTKAPEWLFNESDQVGVNYSNCALAEKYDSRHERFRDFHGEAGRIYKALNLSHDSIILDMGCGTGGISIHLARMCKHVYAVDISQAMIDIFRERLSQMGLNNTTTVCSGFLTYKHRGLRLDAVISNVALHHLPDFWKQVALCRFYEMLKLGGKLFLSDVVYGFPPRDSLASIETWLSSMKAMAGNAMTEETIIHVREEYSTWNWILKGMLERAHFHIDSRVETMDQMFAYTCSKR